MTTPGRAKTIVVGSSIATGVLTSITATVTEKRIPRARTLVAVAVAAVFMLALADAAPSVATGFAILMLVTALTQSGPGLAAVTNIIGG